MCDVLKVEHPGQVSCQGVGPAYDAGLENLKEPEDTTDVAINEAASLIELATRKCPKSKIFVGGYRYVIAIAIFIQLGKYRYTGIAS